MQETTKANNIQPSNCIMITKQKVVSWKHLTARNYHGIIINTTFQLYYIILAHAIYGNVGVIHRIYIAKYH